LSFAVGEAFGRGDTDLRVQKDRELTCAERFAFITTFSLTCLIMVVLVVIFTVNL
jgi:hypothetical protein